MSLPTAGGLITIVPGDGYYTADGREFTWTGTSANVWPDLTGASVALHVGNLNAVAGSVGTPTGTQAVSCQLTSAQSALYVRPSYRYDVKATLADGHVVTLLNGTVNVVTSEAV